MANEITMNVALQVRNGKFVDLFNPGQIQINQAAIGQGGPGVQIVGDTNEAVNFGDISTNGIMVLQNLDTNSYVLYGPASGNSMVTFGKLKPGEVAIMRVAPTVTMRAQVTLMPA